METLILIAFVVIAIFVINSGKHKRRRKNTRNDESSYIDDHLEVVKHGGYKTQPLINNSEKKVLYALIKSFKEAGFITYPQVSLGEILKHPDRKAYRAIMSKRVDFCIVDRRYKPHCCG
ncbi:MAG: DUF2726 domain-containing protein [Pseudomonadota bacterium]